MAATNPSAFQVHGKSCSSDSEDGKPMRGFELVVEIGPFGLQLFVGKAR